MKHEKHYFKLILTGDEDGMHHTTEGNINISLGYSILGLLQIVEHAVISEIVRAEQELQKDES